MSTKKRALAEKAPKARISGFLLEETAPTGIELIIGGLRDPQFGPAVMFGTGGFAVELVKDVSFRLAPLNREEVFEMMREVKSYPLLTGFRDTKPVDLEKLASAVIKLSEILLEILMEKGAMLVGVADSRGTIYNPRGLDVEALIELKKAGKSVAESANAGGVICAAMEYQGAGRSAAFPAIEEKVCRNTRRVLEDAATKGILPWKAAVDLAVQRLKKSMSYRRWSLFSSAPGFV